MCRRHGCFLSAGYEMLTEPGPASEQTLHGCKVVLVHGWQQKVSESCMWNIILSFTDPIIYYHQNNNTHFSYNLHACNLSPWLRLSKTECHKNKISFGTIPCQSFTAGAFFSVCLKTALPNDLRLTLPGWIVSHLQSCCLQGLTKLEPCEAPSWAPCCFLITTTAPAHLITLTTI